MAASLASGRFFYEAWLLYFNRTLLDRDVITEEEYREMKKRIARDLRKDGGKTYC